jgi:hypothetical protein
MSSKWINIMIYDLIDKITSAILFKYKGDPSNPSLLISKLDNGHYYCSIVRYDEKYGRGKRVMSSASNLHLATALKEVAKKNLSEDQTVTPVKELEKFLDNMDKSTTKRTNNQTTYSPFDNDFGF